MISMRHRRDGFSCETLGNWCSRFKFRPASIHRVTWNTHWKILDRLSCGKPSNAGIRVGMTGMIFSDFVYMKEVRIRRHAVLPLATPLPVITSFVPATV